MFWHNMVAIGPFSCMWASHKTMWALRGALQGLHGGMPVLSQKILDKLPRWLLSPHLRQYRNIGQPTTVVIIF
jgi:hypothetical protein